MENSLLVESPVVEFDWITIGEGEDAHHVFLPGANPNSSSKGSKKSSASGSGPAKKEKENEPAPNPEAAKTKAFGSDPTKTYEFKHEIVDLKDLITSNTESGAVNPDYTKELQPRNRERTASKQQVEKIAKTFVPEAALWDFHQLDKGPAIIGPDNMVESGNGRTIAMKKMAADHPEKWAEYQDKLKQHLGQAGLSEKDLEGKSQPVLVRRRISDVDRAAFAQEANTAPVLQMSATEQALVDSKHISDAHISRLEVGDDQTIDQALRSPKNKGFVSDFVGTLTPAERGPLMRGDGSLSQQGLWRVKAAVFTKTFPGEAGTRLADTFLESIDSNIKNFESGLSGALPKMAQADSLIKSGSRDASLDISEDVSKSVDMLARLKEQGMPVQKFLNQGNMFGSELNPFQEKLLSHFDSMSRSAKSIREFLNGYADAVISAPNPHQGNLFGPEEGPTKEGIVNRLMGKSMKDEEPAQRGMFGESEKAKPVPQLTKKNIVPAADSLAAALLHDKAIQSKIDKGHEVKTATFDLNGDLEETDDYVIVRGKIFEVGDYPDKNFSITEEELADAVANFKPVPVDYSHVEGPLDNKLGEMRSISLDPQNNRVALGEVAIPKWLDRALGDTARKVSCTWNRATKQIERLALVNNPRIADAVLYAAFIDDQLEKFKEGTEAAFEGKRNSAPDKQTIQKVHDHTVSLGAECSGENVQYSDDHNSNQDHNKEFQKVMNEENKTIDFKDSAEFKAQASEIEQMKAEMERMRAATRHTEAVAGVEALLREGKAVPAERTALIAAFELAATDDARNPVKVTFGEGGEAGSRVDALKAVYAARPAHVLFGETVPVGGSVLFTQSAKDPNEISKDRIKELLAASPLGQSVLEDGK